MTTRLVVPVEDDEVDIPIIDGVRLSPVHTVREPDNDPFSQDAESVKSLVGTDAVFKRRVTNNIKKYQRGTDGTSSKKIETDTITAYNAFDVVMPPYNLEYLCKLYELSAPHYAAVNAKVANIVGLGFKLVETPKTKRVLELISDNEKKTKNARRKLDEHRDSLLEQLESFNEEDTFTEALIKVWRDYEATGNGYLEIGRKANGQIGYVGHISSQTMRIRRGRDGFVQIAAHKVQFFRNFGDKKSRSPINSSGRPNEVIHIKRYSPTHAFYGIPDIIAAKNAVAGMEFAARFNLDYFEYKAIPRYAIILKGARLGTNAETSLLEFFETGLKGKNHRSLYIPLPPDTSENKVELKFESIESSVQDSSFNNYNKANLLSILMAHRVPITKVSVGDGASLAVARDADKTFKEQVCAPEQKIMEKKLNRLVKELTDAFELKLNEMTLTDADTQSKIWERAAKNQWMLPNEIRAELGLQGIKGGESVLDLKGDAAAEASTNRERDAQRSANATDSRGEARSPKGSGRTDGTA